MKALSIYQNHCPSKTKTLSEKQHLFSSENTNLCKKLNTSKNNKHLPSMALLTVLQIWKLSQVTLFSKLYYLGRNDALLAGFLKTGNWSCTMVTSLSMTHTQPQMDCDRQTMEVSNIPWPLGSFADLPWPIDLIFTAYGLLTWIYWECCARYRQGEAGSVDLPEDFNQSCQHLFPRRCQKFFVISLTVSGFKFQQCHQSS